MKKLFFVILFVSFCLAQDTLIISYAKDTTIQLKEPEPDSATIYFYRGYIESEKKEFSLAIEDLNKAIELSSVDYIDAYFIRGLCYIATGKYLDAIDDFSSVIILAPNSFEAFYNRGIAYDSIGYKHIAINEYRIAKKLYLQANSSE